jgi:PAS domain S-box-containing protein
LTEPILTWKKIKANRLMSPQGKAPTEAGGNRQNRLAIELRQTAGFLDSLTTCVAKCDLDGGIINCNSAFIQAAGLDREEVIFKKVYDLPWLAHSEKERTRIKDALTWAATGKRHSLESLFHLKDRGTVPFCVSINPVTDEIGQVIFLSFEAKELTEHLHSLEKLFPKDSYSARLKITEVNEKSRLRSEALQSRLQSEKLSSLGRLAAGVAHEINNPLTSIIGCSEYLTKDTRIAGKAREAVDIILNEARRSSQIVRNLLSFSRQSVPEKVVANLNDIIRAVLEIRKYGLRNKGIKVNLELMPELPSVKVDMNQLQQVILNIINNTVDAIEESGKGSLIVIRTFVKAGMVIGEIEDDGPGIPNDSFLRIFDPFFTTKGPGKGTGLGLSISYGIIREHGGEIEVNTAGGKGTKFSIGIPVYRPEKKGEKIT